MIKKKILLIFRIIPCSIPTMHIDINDCDGKFGERKKNKQKTQIDKAVVCRITESCEWRR